MQRTEESRRGHCKPGIEIVVQQVDNHALVCALSICVGLLLSRLGVHLSTARSKRGPTCSNVKCCQAGASSLQRSSNSLLWASVT